MSEFRTLMEPKYNYAQLKQAYEVYKRLFTEGGKEFADDKICGHEVWDE